MPDIVRQPTLSNWNYALPITASLVWGGFWVSTISYIGYEIHNYKYPENPINPDLVSAAKTAMISLSSIGLATIPISVGVTILKAGAMGCVKLGGGARSAGQSCCEVIKKSASCNKLGEKAGIIINTVAAPFATLIGCCYLLGRSQG